MLQMAGHGGHREWKNSKQGTSQTVLTITIALTKTTTGNCTFRAKRVEKHDPHYCGAPSTFNFVLAPLPPSRGTIQGIPSTSKSRGTCPQVYLWIYAHGRCHSAGIASKLARCFVLFLLVASCGDRPRAVIGLRTQGEHVPVLWLADSGSGVIKGCHSHGTRADDRYKWPGTSHVIAMKLRLSSLVNVTDNKMGDCTKGNIKDFNSSQQFRLVFLFTTGSWSAAAPADLAERDYYYIRLSQERC